jgi:hypothetical protein
VMGKAAVQILGSGNTGKKHVPRARLEDWCLTRKRTPMMASGKCRVQAGHKGATDRIFRSRRSAIAEPQMTTALSN